MSKSKRGPVPKRWLKCPRISLNLIDNKFFAFKVPLSEHFHEDVPPGSRFYPEMLIDLAKRKKYNLGLWFDLTNTKRFYNKEIVQQNEIAYFKLECKGHGETPSKEQTLLFNRVVTNFIAQNPLMSIGVHCTHGFNRTGFLIVSYLVEVKDYDLPVALSIFADARPPGIYKGDYLKELYRRHSDVEDTPPPPQLPDWCFEDDDESESDNDDDNAPQASSNDTKVAERKANRRVKPAKFMEGVPGVTHFTEQPKAFQLQQQVQVMCASKTKGFSGAQPVSMDSENIHFLNQMSYRVSWKADGMRYMMLIAGPNEVYFFDRDNNVFQVQNLRFPSRKCLEGHIRNTLLDGEMVIDKVDGKSIPRYLAYDIVQFDKCMIRNDHFHPNRLQCLDYEIIQPRYEAMKQGIIDKTKEPFAVRLKHFWDVTQTSSLLSDKFASTLPHEPDGLIFQPTKDPYIGGPCDKVLKWKPIDMNSIDFRLRIETHGGTGKIPTKVCLLYVGKQDQPFARMAYTPKVKNLDGKIIECNYENGRWKFMRERTDKSFPNSVNTATAVYKSIIAPITKEYLLEYISKRLYRNDAEAMPPPSKRPRK